ncbi:hypothetical protein C8J56DRAFT_893777 [Mycena floridula]|nr:hypothetical protein C8J56DRAFT_893777 [Mycena floridula]
MSKHCGDKRRQRLMGDQIGSNIMRDTVRLRTTTGRIPSFLLRAGAEPVGLLATNSDAVQRLISLTEGESLAVNPLVAVTPLKDSQSEYIGELKDDWKVIEGYGDQWKIIMVCRRRQIGGTRLCHHGMMVRWSPNGILEAMFAQKIWCNGKQRKMDSMHTEQFRVNVRHSPEAGPTAAQAATNVIETGRPRWKRTTVEVNLSNCFVNMNITMIVFLIQKIIWSEIRCARDARTTKKGIGSVADNLVSPQLKPVSEKIDPRSDFQSPAPPCCVFHRSSVFHIHLCPTETHLFFI